LEKAVERRGELYQAQGMVMVQLGVGLIEALVRIRAHSYAQDRNLNDVAADIIARKLRFDPERPEAR
jgi:AmiR/NasT family two-component response regulator